MSKNILIFGGAFSPIHKSHSEMAMKLTNYGEVWIMPAFISMWGKQVVSYEHRLNMCRLATQYIPDVHVSDWEGRNADIAPQGTFVLMNKLKKDYPTYQFRFVIGMDNALKMNKWIKWEELVFHNSFVVVPRADYETPIEISGNSEDYEKNAWFYKGSHIYLRDLKVSGIASTQFRDLLKAGNIEEAKRHIDKPVWDYIISHNLYTEGPPS